MAVGGTSYGTGPSANAVIYVYTNGVLSATAGTWTTVPTAYAIWGKLSTGNLFCIDSTGNTRNPSATITAGTLSGAGNNGQYQACQ